MFSDVTFDRPLFLLTLAIPALVALRAWRRSRAAETLAFPAVWLVEASGQTLRTRLRRLPGLLRLLTLTVLGLVLAGPVVVRTTERTEPGGLDILLLVDASRSMLAQDVTPNRFEAARAIAERLVAARPDDRFGLMTFAARAVLRCPLTADRAALVSQLRRLRTLEREEGTALGVAVSDALRLIRSTARRPAAIVLLTDGGSNAGQIAPGMAGAIAAGMNVHVHAVGLGGSGPVPYPSEFGLIEVTLDLDDGTLERLASSTGGAYVPLTTDGAFERLSAALNRFDAPPGVVATGRAPVDAADRWLIVALICLLVELALRATYLRAFP